VKTLPRVVSVKKNGTRCSPGAGYESIYVSPYGK
jgi:hypothetical protein